MAKTLSNYNPTVNIGGGITPAGGEFPVAESHDILVDSTGKRLDTKLSEIDAQIGGTGETSVATQLSQKVAKSDITTTAPASTNTDAQVPSTKSMYTALATKPTGTLSTAKPVSGSTDAQIPTSKAVYTGLAEKVDTANITTTAPASTNTDTQVPSTKSVYTALSGKVNTSDIASTVAATGSTSATKVPSETAVREAIEAKTIPLESSIPAADSSPSATAAPSVAATRTAIDAAIDDASQDFEDAAAALQTSYNTFTSAIDAKIGDPTDAADDGATAVWPRLKNAETDIDALSGQFLITDALTTTKMADNTRFYIYTGKEIHVVNATTDITDTTGNIIYKYIGATSGNFTQNNLYQYDTSTSAYVAVTAANALNITVEGSSTAGTIYRPNYWFYYDTNTWKQGSNVSSVTVDSTLSIAGAAADAKATGDAITELSNDVSNIINEVYDNDIIYINKEDYLYNLRVNTGVSIIEEDSTGTRIRIIYEIPPLYNIHFKANLNEEAGIAAAIYSNKNYAVTAGQDPTYIIFNLYGVGAYTKDNIDCYYENKNDNILYLTISIKKLDGTTISDEERNRLYENLQVNITLNKYTSNIVNILNAQNNHTNLINNIYTTLDMIKYDTLFINDANYILIKNIGEGSTTSLQQGDRLRIIFDFTNTNYYLYSIEVQCDYGVGICVSTYENFKSAIAHAPRYNTEYKNLIGTYSKNKASYDDIELYDYLVISVSKVASGAATNEEELIYEDDIEQILSSIDFKLVCKFKDFERLKDAENNIAQLQSVTNELLSSIDNNYLYLGSELINAQLTYQGTPLTENTYDNYRASQKSTTTFPVSGPFDIKVHIPDKYKVGIRTGIIGQSIYNNMYWYYNNDIIHIASGHNYYRFSLSNITNENTTILNIEDVMQEIENIKFEFLGKMPEYDLDIFKTKLANLRLKVPSSGANTLNNYFTLIHTSDVHGDYYRVKAMMDFADEVKADMFAVTGDIVAYDPRNGIAWFHDLIREHTTQVAFSTGNHDVYISTYTDADIYQYMFEPVKDEIKNTENQSWYYIDDVNKNIRVISLNLYQYGDNSRWYTHFLPNQIEFFINALKSTPINFGIILLYHAPQRAISKSTGYDKFWQDDRKYNSLHSNVTGSPINDIIDAFISRTTIEKSYAQQGEPNNVSVSADFSSVDSSIEFIAHLSGHFHQDAVYYVKDCVNKQVMLNITCGNSIYGASGGYAYLADIADHARDLTNTSSISFNAYIIDRDSKLIKILRIGNNMTHNLQDRDYMEISYK